MSELSFVTLGDPAKILYLNPMRDSNGWYKTRSEWVKEIVAFHVEYWNIQYDEFLVEGLAWMYNSIFDTIRKAADLCKYLYDTVIEDQELDHLFHSLNEITDNDFPKLIKEIVK